MECGCKGIRSCCVCEKQHGKVQVDESPFKHIYEYCYKCQKAWLDKKTDLLAENSNKALNHNDTSVEFDNILHNSNETLLNQDKLHLGNGINDRNLKFVENCDQNEGTKSKVENLDCCHHKGRSIEFPGIYIHCGFVSPEEEKAICVQIYETPFTVSQSGRRKQDYGPKVNFKRKKLKVKDFTGLPNYSKEIYDRMRNLEVLSNFKPVELCNLEYSSERGSSIDPHFDDFWLWGERLVTLNLLSDSVLCFTNESHPEIEVHVPMDQRSLLVVYGPARYEWKHAIHRKDIIGKRIAITFRELSEEFKDGGASGEAGNQLLQIALTFNGKAIDTFVKDVETVES